MNPQKESWSKLPLGKFKCAAQALNDTYDGGGHALTLAGDDEESQYLVSCVYSTSSGSLPPNCHPWSCFECGYVFEDFDSAAHCCSPYENFDEEE